MMPFASCLPPLLIYFSFSDSHHTSKTYKYNLYVITISNKPSSSHDLTYHFTIKQFFIFQDYFTSIIALSIFHLRLSLSLRASDLQPFFKNLKLDGYLLVLPLSTKWHDFIVSVNRS